MRFEILDVSYQLIFEILFNTIVKKSPLFSIFLCLFSMKYIINYHTRLFFSITTKYIPRIDLFFNIHDALTEPIGDDDIAHSFKFFQISNHF